MFTTTSYAEEVTPTTRSPVQCKSFFAAAAASLGHPPLAGMTDGLARAQKREGGNA